MRSRRQILALATALTLALATPAFAQQRQVNSGLGIGALAGLTWTSLSTEMNQFNIDTSSDTGVMFGIWFGGNRDGRTGLLGEFSY
jgi:hypothetical protein